MAAVPDPLIHCGPRHPVGLDRVNASGNPLMRFDFIERPYLLAVGVVLFAAFLSLGSDLGLQAPVLVVGLVWAAHLAVGLAALRAAVIGLSRWRATARWPDLALLATAALLASLVLAPVSFAIDQALLARGVSSDDDPLPRPSQWPLGILGEWVQVVGPVVLVALLLGLPGWWSRRRAAPPEPVAAAAPVAPLESVVAEGVGSCLQRLPPALGTEIIAARSELQYVRIYTTRGDALVLGALKDIAEQRAAEGQITHRTWWVADRHVRTLRRRGARYVLTLSNGLEVPVSRRRQPVLLQRFGVSATLN